MTNSENYKDIIKKRCMTCKHWQGDRKKAFDQLNSFEANDQINKFLNVSTTWCIEGDCRELRIEQNLYNADSYSKTLVDAVFGCVLHELLTA